MADHVAYVSGSPVVSRATLEATVGKASQFLYAVGRTPTVLNTLRKLGYTAAVHARGFDLVAAASRRGLEARAVDEEVDEALQILDAWDDKNIPRMDAALTQFPDIRKMILEGLKVGSSDESVRNVEAILERLSAAEESGARGKAAVARLAQVDIDTAERKRLTGLVSVARGAKAFTREVVEEDPAERALLELRDWYYEWSELARQTVTRREHLIRLGLAERRVGGGDDLDIEDPTPFLDPNAPTPTPGS
jgi:hypothetical protein